MSNRKIISDMIVSIDVARARLDDATDEIKALCPMAGSDLAAARQYLVAAENRLRDALQLPIEPLIENVHRINGRAGTTVDLLTSPGVRLIDPGQ